MAENLPKIIIYNWIWNTNQIFIVAGLEESKARITMHEKKYKGIWTKIIDCYGYIGKCGLGKTKEGDQMTPIGVFSFTKAFGIADDPGCSIDYYKVTEDDWWSGDTNYCYNKI